MNKNYYKIIAILLILCSLMFLCSCSLVFFPKASDEKVENLTEWSFKHNDDTNDYSVFFGLLNQYQTYIFADVDADIRIVNESGEEVYNATKSVAQSDFGKNTDIPVMHRRYLAEIRIPEKDILPGKSSGGKVYLTVHKDEIIKFDEVNCDASGLPIADISLETDELPAVINIKGYDGNVESVIQIDDVSFVFEKDHLPTLNITVSGTKTDGKTGFGYDTVCYKIYDSQGYVIDNGNLFLQSLGKGDKSKDDSISIFDVTPGETYKIVFSEPEW